MIAFYFKREIASYLRIEIDTFSSGNSRVVDEMTGKFRVKSPLHST
jgi:hypothetical protein